MGTCNNHKSEKVTEFKQAIKNIKFKGKTNTEACRILE